MATTPWTSSTAVAAVTTILLAAGAVYYLKDNVAAVRELLDGQKQRPGGSVATPPSSLLYLASTSGRITTVNLTRSKTDATKAKLEVVATNDGCGPNPTWLTLDRPNSILYCLDEGLGAPNGSLSSYRTSADGSLAQLDKVITLSGPVSSVIYGHGGKGLAVAEYSGSSVASYNISKPDALATVQSETYALDRPGPDPSRQDVPHPHEAVLDPTGRFLLVPDLGVDIVRVYRVDGASLEWTAVTPLAVTPGSGPRHLVFIAAKDKTFMYVVNELSNTVIGYEVSYHQDDTLGFEEVYRSATHGRGNKTPESAYAAEIHRSPDSRFVIISSRNEASFSIPSFDPDDDGEIPSDSLITFAVDHETGSLSLVQIFPSGGDFPRHFSINKAGTLVAVGLQHDGRVVVIDRDVESGKLKSFIAHINAGGEPACIIFDE